MGKNPCWIQGRHGSILRVTDGFYRLSTVAVPEGYSGTRFFHIKYVVICWVCKTLASNKSGSRTCWLRIISSGLCRKFSFEVIWGMLSPWDAE